MGERALTSSLVRYGADRPLAQRRRYLNVLGAVGGAFFTYLLARRTIPGSGALLLLGLGAGAVMLVRRPVVAVVLLVGLGATVFALPFHPLGIAGSRSDVPELLAYGLIVLMVLRFAAGARGLGGPYTRPVVVIVSAAALGSAYGLLRGVGRQDVQGVLKTYVLYLLAIALTGIFRTEAEQRRLERIVMWISAAGCAWVWAMVVTGGTVASESVTELSTLGALSGVHRYRPPLLTLLALSLLLLVGRMSASGVTPLRLGQLVLFVGTLALGFNRSSWLPLAATCLVLPLMRRRTGSSSGTPLRGIAAIGIALPLLFGAVSVGAFGPTGDAVVERLESVTKGDITKEGSYSDRASETRDALRAIGRSPLMGVGVGGLFGARRPLYRPDLGRVVFVDRPYVHNSYVLAWLQLGIVGLAGIGLLAYQLIRTTARAVKDLPVESGCRVLAAALAIVALGLSAILQPYLLNRPAITVVCLALVLARPPVDVADG